MSGKPISAAQFVERLFGKLPELFRDEAELGMDKLPDLLDLKYGSPSDAVRELGSVADIKTTFRGFQRQLYDAPNNEKNRL